MRKIIAFPAYLAFLFPCLAFANDAKSRDFCLTESRRAEAVMEMRQAGVPIERAYEIVIQPLTEQGFEDSWVGLAEEAIIESYDSPKFSLTEYQDEAINEAKSRKFVSCITRRGIYSNPALDLFYYDDL